MALWLRVVIWLAVLAAAALLVGGIVHEYESFVAKKVAEGKAQGLAEKQAAWDADVRKRDAEKLAAVAAAVKKTQDEAAAVVQGERNAREKAERQAAADRTAAAVALRAAGGLSGNIAALNGAARALGVPDAASCPGEFARQRDAAVRARELLGSCSAEHQRMAAEVDDAWRTVTLKLDTALGYINAVAPHPGGP